MPLLKDIVTDLINEIKESKDVSARLFSLEQIKEIVFHRDRSLLKDAIIEFSTNLIIDKSASIRKFLLKFGGDAMLQDPSVFPHLLNMIKFALFDPNDSVLTLGIKQFQTYYNKFILMIAELPASSVKGSLQDPLNLWNMFSDIQLKFNDIIASTRSDGLKLACLELYETEVLFGLPSIAVASADPRSQRVDPRLARMQETKEAAVNIDSISLHHPVVSRTKLKTGAEDLYARMLVWSTSGGPHGFPFSHALNTALVRIIADVGSAKPDQGVNAAKALLVFIKGSVIQSMSGESKENIARAAHRMIRSVTVSKVSDSQNALPTLKTALEELEQQGFADNKTGVSGNAVESAAGKRDRKAFEGAASSEISGSQDEDESEESLALQEAAKRAVDLATSASGVIESGSASSAVSASVSVEADTTVLCTDVDKLNCDDGITAATTSSLDMSFLVLKQLMASFETMKQQDARTVQSYYTLCIRTVLSLVRREMSSLCGISSVASSSYVNVRIISAVSNSPVVSRYFPALVPDMVELPKSLWVFLCFLLDSTINNGSMISSDRLKEVTEKFELLSKFISSYCNQFVDPGADEEVADETQTVAHQCYETFCLCLLSRLVQTVHLRPLAKDFLLLLPSVPPCCLNVLFLLLATGSKPDIVQSTSKTSTSSASKYRGTRQEALLLISALVFHPSDSDTGAAALNHLLWNCVSEDFEVRAKTVNNLITDVLFAEEWCDELILKFALHSVISVMENDVSTWYQNLQSRQDEKMLKAEFANYSLLVAFESYDKGGIFHGTFESATASADLKKSFHLLLQLCLQNKLAVGSLIDVYSLCCGTSFVDSKLENNVLQTFVYSELRSLLPALSQKDSIDGVVEIVVEFAFQYEEQVAFKVLLDALNILFQDWVQVPSKAVLDKVALFIRHFQKSVVSSETDEMVVDDSATGAESPAISLVSLSEIEFKLMVPLIAGFNATEVQSSLYQLLKLYGEDSEALQLIFNRITKSRPPVISKTQLLVDLHRLNVDGELKPKAILDAIAVCLNNKVDYSIEIIKDALKNLLSDVVPAFPLMRTAILASQSYAEVRRYVISEVIPALIKKKVWASAPKVWEGVIYVVKHSSASSLKNDYVLKAILSVPGVQLKSVVKSAPNVMEHLSALLHHLSPEDKDDMLSGRWLDTTAKPVQDNEKFKVIQELSAIKA